MQSTSIKRLHVSWLTSCLFFLLNQAHAGQQAPELPHTGRLLFRHSLPRKFRAQNFYRDLHQELTLHPRFDSWLRDGNNNSLQLRLDNLHHLAQLDVAYQIPPEQMSMVYDILNAHPDIEFVEEDKPVFSFSAEQPNDPNITQQWALFGLGLFAPNNNNNVASVKTQSIQQQPLAWDVTEGSSDIIVCVIDSGTDYKHPDLKQNLWVNTKEIPGNLIDDDGNGLVDDYHGYNFKADSPGVLDDYFHGTHLAGIVGAQTNNGQGVAGVAPKVKIMTCKFLGSNGAGSTSDAIRCMSYALQMGAHITLNSWGGPNADSESLRTAVQAASDAGQLFITAAGNEQLDIDMSPIYPSSYTFEGLISVIATDESEQLAWYTNRGLTSTDLAAPGSNILSTIPDGYGYHDGSSQSAAFVAGAAALLYSAYIKQGVPVRNISLLVKETLLQSSRPLASLNDTCTTGGILDIGAALSSMTH